MNYETYTFHFENGTTANESGLTMELAIITMMASLIAKGKSHKSIKYITDSKGFEYVTELTTGRR